MQPICQSARRRSEQPNPPVHPNPLRRRGPDLSWASLQRTSRPLARAARCNLLEDEEAPVEVEGATLKLSLRPFEIVTLKVVPAR